MARSKDRERLYQKGRGFYADFRDFADVGGAQEALKPPGERWATKDEDVAHRLLFGRLDELKAKREGKGSAQPDDPRLEDYARRHLRLKRTRRRESTVQRDERSFRKLLEYFGADVRLSEITVARLLEYLEWRMTQRGRKPDNYISPQTALHELHALSNLYRGAMRRGLAAVNPVALLGDEKPRVERDEAVWLEVGEAARMLKEAANRDANPHPRALPYFQPVLATYLLTGGRRTEVFGLEVRDVDFEHGVVHFRPNDWRKLKNVKHCRTVPLWPQLREILDTYLERYDRRSGLLFPAQGGGMLKDLGGSIRATTKAAEIDKDVTTHTFRHTYTATRMQTLDHGQPVSPWTVASELGHQSFDLIKKTYGHLQQVRHRSNVVEYREATVTPIGERRRA